MADLEQALKDAKELKDGIAGHLELLRTTAMPLVDKWKGEALAGGGMSKEREDLVLFFIGEVVGLSSLYLKAHKAVDGLSGSTG